SAHGMPEQGSTTEGALRRRRQRDAHRHLDAHLIVGDCGCGLLEGAAQQSAATDKAARLSVLPVAPVGATISVVPPAVKGTAGCVIAARPCSSSTLVKKEERAERSLVRAHEERVDREVVVATGQLRARTLRCSAGTLP